MNRFPNISEANKDRLLRLFLMSGSYRIDGDIESFIIDTNSQLNNLDPDYANLIKIAMNDLYDPSIGKGRAFITTTEVTK